jgi:hypothetical protein
MNYVKYIIYTSEIQHLLRKARIISIYGTNIMKISVIYGIQCRSGEIPKQWREQAIRT